MFMKVLVLDGLLYNNLKSSKKSLASKVNTDSVENYGGSFSMKSSTWISLLFSFNGKGQKRKTTRRVERQGRKAAKCALKLWSVLFSEFNQLRHQTFPKYESFLDFIIGTSFMDTSLESRKRLDVGNH